MKSLFFEQRKGCLYKAVNFTFFLEDCRIRHAIEHPRTFDLFSKPRFDLFPVRVWASKRL